MSETTHDTHTVFTAPRMLTDFAEHGELPKYIERHKMKLDERHIAQWGLQIAKAMEYLEGEQIVHRLVYK